MNPEEREATFSVTIEPVYIPEKGRVIDYLHLVQFDIQAKDISDAMQKAQDLLRIDSDKYDIISVVQQGHRYVRPRIMR